MTYLPSSFGTRYWSASYTVKLQNPVDVIGGLPWKVKRKADVGLKVKLSDLFVMKRFLDWTRSR